MSCSTSVLVAGRSLSDRRATMQVKRKQRLRLKTLSAIGNSKQHLNQGAAVLRWVILGADVIDRNPTPPPPGVVQLSATIRAGHPTMRARLRERRRLYPSPPSGRFLDPDVRHVQAMLSQLDRYHQGRSTLASMAYFCLTTLEGRVPEGNGKANKDRLTRDHYAISRRVLKTGASAIFRKRGARSA